MEEQDSRVDPPLLHESKTLNPWQPERDAHTLAILGKLAEELNEAGAIVARCIIQGIGEAEPVTQVPNRLQLLKELADVRATSEMAIWYFNLDEASIALRAKRKTDHLLAWHRLIGPIPDPEQTGR